MWGWSAIQKPNRSPQEQREKKNPAGISSAEKHLRNPTLAPDENTFLLAADQTPTLVKNSYKIHTMSKAEHGKLPFSMGTESRVAC